MRSVLFILFISWLLPVAAQTSLMVTLEKTDERCVKGNAVVSVSGGGLPYKIKWSTGDSVVTSSSSHTAGGLTAGEYSVLVKDDQAKDTTIFFTIEKIECEVGIANHFTPNDDGYNDTWFIGNLTYYPNFEIIVFNRWGQMVHRQQGQYVPWDGKALGIPAPDATYYYVFYFDKDNRDKLLKGDLTILR